MLTVVQVRVVAGEHDLYADEGLEQVAGVASSVIHPRYNPSTMENDICLLRLDKDFTLTQEVGVLAIVLTSADLC